MLPNINPRKIQIFCSSCSPILRDNRACLPQARFKPDRRQASCSGAGPTKSFWQAYVEI